MGGQLLDVGLIGIIYCVSWCLQLKHQKKFVPLKNNYLLSVSCFMRGGVKIEPFVIPITSLKTYKNNLLPTEKTVIPQ